MRADFAGVPVMVTELSLSGARIRHESRLPSGSMQTLRIPWEQGGTVRAYANIIRSTVIHLAKREGESSLYDTGLKIAPVDEVSQDILRDVISSYVIRAINEQVSNARGIPPLAAYSYQTGKSDRFRRCELVGEQWRKTETDRPDQPTDGFTVSTDVDPFSVELLCRTWELCDAEGRRLTQLLAELSTSKSEGIPTRRYLP
jgi:hypothetical protein